MHATTQPLAAPAAVSLEPCRVCVGSGRYFVVRRDFGPCFACKGVASAAAPDRRPARPTAAPAAPLDDGPVDANSLPVLLQSVIQAVHQKPQQPAQGGPTTVTANQTIIATSVQLPIPEGCALQLLDAGMTTAIVRKPASPTLANCVAGEVIQCRIVVVLNGLVFNAIKPEYLL
jgi:hypothetical protein